MSRKNVLHILNSFHQGGTEHQAIQLIRLLHQEGNYRVFVACINKSGVLRSEIEKLGFTSIPEFPLSSFYDRNALLQVARFSKFISENNISLLQTHDFYTNVFGMAAGGVARVPVRIAAKRETGMRNRQQRFIERRAFNMAHAIVVNANAVREYLIGAGVDSRKISTIHNGLDLQRFESGVSDRAEVLATLGLPNSEGAKFVTILANLRSSVKNHRMFFRAAQRVNEKLKDVNFIVAGEGDLINETKAFAENLGLEKQSFFIGRCPNVPDLLSISDVCVLTSESEGFSNAILEYMAAGKPVVATLVGGASEAILENESGFLVPSNDDYALAVRLIEVLESPERAKIMGRKGREIVEEKFSLRAQLENTLSLYKKLMSF